jgi:phage-related protein
VPFDRAVPKPCIFVGASRRELKSLPAEVRGEFGHALYEAQCGGEPVAAKVLKGFGGRGVLEIVEDFDGSTYRAVYTVRFTQAVYVLRVFQKKSKKGIATPKTEIELVKTRLRVAEADHHERFGSKEHKP